MIPNRTLKNRLLENPEVKAEYDKLAPGHELARELVRARARAGLTQAQVAKRMGTTQSAIARLESGRPPSMKSLQRFADATGSKVFSASQAKSPQLHPAQPRLNRDLSAGRQTRFPDYQTACVFLTH